MRAGGEVEPLLQRVAHRPQPKARTRLLPARDWLLQPLQEACAAGRGATVGRDRWARYQPLRPQAPRSRAPLVRGLRAGAPHPRRAAP